MKQPNDIVMPEEQVEIASIVKMRTIVNKVNRRLLEKGAKLTQYEDRKIITTRSQAYRYYA